MKRIVIIGTCGSGKTTLGRKLAKRLNIPVTDLDDLYWLPQWKKRPKEEFTALIKKAAQVDEWIICGNQSKYQSLFWPKADTILFLDLPIYLLFYRLVKRSIKQMISGELICNGNHQTLYRSFWILLYLFRSYRRIRKRYQKLSKTNSHVSWIHLPNAKAMDAFFRTLI